MAETTIPDEIGRDWGSLLLGVSVRALIKAPLRNITPSWNPSLADGDAEVGPSLEALGTVVQKLPFDVGTVPRGP